MTFDKALESHKQKMSERKTESLADKMFEELGFNKFESMQFTNDEKVWSDLYFETEWDKKDSNYRERVHFYVDNKRIELSAYSNNRSQYDLELTVELHLAIHQKGKELGWWI